jgi:tRNA(adenine34) deaminase
MELGAGDRGDYPSGAVVTRLVGGREVVIASAGNRVKTSGSSIKHVELETLKYVSSGYGRYLPDFVLYSTHEPCAMCAGACVWSRIGAVVYGVSQQDIAAYGRKHGTEDRKWRACLIPCRLVFEKGNHPIPVTGGFLRQECQKLFSYDKLSLARCSTCPPEKPQESLILGRPFSVVSESRRRVNPRHSPFYCRFQRWSDELSSFYSVFVWWSRRLGGHSHVAVM